MSSSTVPGRRSIGMITGFLGILPGILLSGGVYTFLNWELLGPTPDGFAGIAGVTACIVPALISMFARPGHAAHWFAFVVIVALAMSLAALSTVISSLFFRDLITGVDSPVLAGMLHGSPGLIVGPVALGVLHRLAGDASPWKLDED